MATNNRLLYDDDGKPLPFRMHPDTWQALKDKRKSDMRIDLTNLYFGGVEVILNKNITPGQIIQARIEEDIPIIWKNPMKFPG